MEKVKNIFKSLPVALTGLALGVSGVSGALAMVYNPKILIIGNVISLFLLIPIVFKNLLHFNVFYNELKHPTLGSFIPTLDMALMNTSVVLYKLSPVLGKGLWLLCIIMHIVFATLFMYHRFKEWDIHHMVPSWFVPPIGIVVACVTSPLMGMPELSHILFYVGFIFYVIMLPMMLYRIMFLEPIDENRLPIFAVMAAPPNLCLAGYLIAFQNPDPALVRLLFPLGIFMTVLIYISMYKIFKIAFTPVYASFTFPLAIGSTAILKYSSYIGKIDVSRGEFWYMIGQIATTVAGILIFGIFVKTVIFVWHKIIKKELVKN